MDPAMVIVIVLVVVAVVVFVAILGEGGMKPTNNPSNKRTETGRGGDQETMAQVAGQAFAFSVKRGRIPPPAAYFVNRALNGSADNWTADYESIRDEVDYESLGASLEKLTALLSELQDTPVTLPTLMAAEASVTANLAAYTLQLAEGICDRNPEWFANEQRSVTGDGLGWWPGANPVIQSVAATILYEASATVITFHTAAADKSDRPDLAFRFAITELERIAKKLEGRLDNLVDLSGNPMQQQFQRTLEARDALDKFMERVENR